MFRNLANIPLIHLIRVRHVYGYEVVKQAIADARLNAVLNGISNATFIEGDLNKIDDNFGNDFPKPDIIISGNIPVFAVYFCYILFFNLSSRVHIVPIHI